MTRPCRHLASRALAGTLALTALGALVGCAGRPQHTAVRDRLVWPQPPLPARIEFVRSVASDEDVGRDTTFSQRLLHVLGGELPPPNRLVEPMGLAVSDDGQRLYVSDFRQSAVFVFDFARRSFVKIGDGGLSHPIGLALDGAGNLHVVEQGAKAITVFSPEGQRLRSITHPNVERPTGIAIDRQRGRIYLADTGHTRSVAHTVKVFDTRGELVGTIGDGKGEGPAQLLFPTYLALDAQGRLYVSDTLNSRVQVFDVDGSHVKTVGRRGSGWGMFDKPKGVALDSFGNVYVVDSGWSNVQIFNERGQVLLFFGGRGPMPGMLKNPTAIAIDAANRIYVADFLNHRVEVYRLVNTTAADSFAQPIARTGQAHPDVDGVR